MHIRTMLKSGVTVLLLALAAAPAVQAQLAWTANAGVAFPAGTFSEYFRFGPTVGLEAAYPLQEKVDLTFNADFDHYNHHAYFGTPNVNLFRLQVGVSSALVGDKTSPWSIEAHAKAGGSNLRSQRIFFHEASTHGEDLTQYSFSTTSFAGSAGLRLRFGGDSRLSGFVGTNGLYAKIGSDAAESLRLTEPTELSELSAVLSYAFTAGFSVRP